MEPIDLTQYEFIEDPHCDCQDCCFGNRNFAFCNKNDLFDQCGTSGQVGGYFVERNREVEDSGVMIGKFLSDTKLSDVINAIGILVSTEKHNQYAYLPYWFEIRESGIYKHELGQLPEDLKDAINVVGDTEKSMESTKTINYTESYDFCYDGNRFKHWGIIDEMGKLKG